MLSVLAIGAVSGGLGWWYAKRTKVADIYKLYDQKKEEIGEIPKPVSFFSHVCSYDPDLVLPRGKATDDLRKHPYTAYEFIYKHMKCVLVKHPDLLWNGYIEHSLEKIHVRCHDETTDLDLKPVSETLKRYWTFEMSYNHLIDTIDKLVSDGSIV